MKGEKEKDMVTRLRQDRKVMIIAIVCAVAAVFLVYLYLQSKKEPYGSLVPVLAAAADMEKGDVFTKSSIEIKRIPKMLVTPGSITPSYLASILDMKTLVPLSKKQPILWSYVQTQKVTEALSEVLSKEHNERAVTIAVDEVSSVAGYILPNDRVDVIGTFTVPGTKPNVPPVTKTKTILQCVTVLAVGTATGSRRTHGQQFGLQGVPTSVTLKIKPEEAELLTFAESSGHLRLLLRNRDDFEVDEHIPIIDFSNLFEVEKKQTHARKDYIRIIYGMQKK